MGQGSTGSYALGSIKGSLAAIAIESKCKEICNVINQHLIPLIADLNDWDMTRLPELHMSDLEAVSLEETSKYFQRLASVGFLPRTPEVIDRILEIAGLDSLPEDTDLDEVLTSSTSKAGEGFKTANAGTSTDPTNISTGDGNLENTA